MLIYLEQMLWPFFRTAAFCYNQPARSEMTTEFLADIIQELFLIPEIFCMIHANQINYYAS